MIGEVHPQMPFMTGHAMVDPERFDWLVEDARYDYDLYCPPNLPIGTVDHAIGMHASSLVRDGGTLQVGIGELGDALVYALLLRHQQNASYREALRGLGSENTAALIDAEGGREPFSAGLFASTEMFIDQILDLYRAGDSAAARVRQPRAGAAARVPASITERIDARRARRACRRGSGARALRCGIRGAAALRCFPA